MVRALRRMLATVGAVALFPIGLAAQEAATIGGQVLSQDGKPIAGATIAIPEMGLGATSRTDGRYTVTIPAARVQGQRVSVTARAINFKPQTVQVTIAPGQQTQDFSLAPNPLQLGEIVVTGTGTTTEVEKNPNVRNSVSAEAITKSNETNVIQALAAQAPGVQVSQQSGEPGAGSFINIRGIRTVYGDAQPLIVVDGTPIDNGTYSTGQFNPTDELLTPEVAGVVNMNRAADINPSDIESVEILKGAAASALYGSRAASGVILIKTKSGRAGPTHFSIGTTYSSDHVAHYYDLQTQYGQGTLGVDPRVANPAACDVPSSACRRSWGPDLTTNPVGVPTTIYDHSKEAYTDGYNSTTQATVSGGNDRTTFFVSGEYVYNRGVFVGPNNKFQRGTVRLNASQRIGENFKVGGNISYANTFGQFVQRGNNVNGLQLGLLRTPPNFNNLPYLDTTGTHRSYLFQHPTASDIAVNRGFDNPFYTLYEGQNTSQVNRVFGNVNLDYQATKILKFAYTLGGDYAQDERMNAAGQQSSDVSVGGRVVEGKITTLSLDQNLNGSIAWRRSPDLAGTVTVGTTLNIRNYRDLGNTGRTLIAQPPFRLSNTVTRDPVIDNQTNIHNLSFFGQATVDLWNQFYITAAATRFGSSTFTADQRYRWYPKVGASWEFTKALHLQEGSFLSYGKLRAAYGEAGTEALPYVTNATLNSLPFFGAVQGTALTPTIGGNDGLSTSITSGAASLGPEVSKETEIGTDIGFWKDKADISFTFYHSLTDNVILPLPVAPSTGYLYQWQNAMQLRNQGAEVSLNVRPIITRDVSWDIGLQWSKNKSHVNSIKNNVAYVGTDPAGATAEFVQFVAIPGQEYGVLRSQGYIRCGVTPAGTLVNGSGTDIMYDPAIGGCNGKPKGALWIDDGSFGTAGLPVDDPTLRVVANPNPNWLGSARTSVRWKKLTLSGLIDIKNGGQVWNGTKGALLSYGTAKETQQRCTFVAGVCTGNQKVIGTDALYGMPAQPVAGPGAGTPVAIGQSYYTGLAACPFSGIDEGCIEDGGYVKFRELSLGWTVDYPWVQKSLGLSSIDVRVAGRNLHTWSNYSGYDPEANLGGNISARSTDYFNSPQTRSFVFSVTLNR